MQLTDHFSLEELTFSSTAARLNIDNTPPDAIVEHLKVAAAGMEEVRSELGDIPIHVDSGYRCEALEKVLTVKDYEHWCALHGHPVNDTSWGLYFARKAHPQGYAVDFICPAFGAPTEIVARIKASEIAFDELILEGSWVHISFAPALRRLVLTATFGPDGPVYSQGTST